MIMNKLLLLIIICLFTYESIAQNKTDRSFRDYLTPKNVDSLVRVMNKAGISADEYLHQLLYLERSRRMLKPDDFGKNFGELEKAATQQKSKNALAMLNYFRGSYSETKNKDTIAFKYYLKAIRLFSEVNDTTGLILTYNNLIGLNADLNKPVAQQYLKELLTLSKNSSFAPDRLIGLGFILQRNELISPLPTIKEMLNKYEEAQQLFKKYPATNYMRFPILTRLQGGLRSAKRYDLYLKYAKEGLNFLTGHQTKYIVYNNIGDAYLTLNQYDSCIVYMSKATKSFELEKGTDIPTILNYYEKLAKAYFMNNQFKEAYMTDIHKDSLTKVLHQNSQKIALTDIQTKYETEKKDATIRRLDLEKQLITNRNWYFFIGFIIAVALLSIMSFLAFKLKVTNTNLQRLQKERNRLYTIIAHDLRSPLNTFQQFSSIVKNLAQSKQYKRLDNALQQMDIIGLNLASMLNGLLQWSLLEQSKPNTKEIVVNSKTYFETLLPIYRKMASLKSIDFNENITETDIRVISESLSVILRNLLDNSIKYSSEGTTIHLDTKTDEDKYIITITNENEVFSDEQKRKVKALFDGTKTYSFGEDGLGVGLILAKQYADVSNVKVVFIHNQDDGLVIFKVIIEKAVQKK